MAEQNFKNHGRYVPMFHFVAFTAALFPFVIVIINFIKAIGDRQRKVECCMLWYHWR